MRGVRETRVVAGPPQGLALSVEEATEGKGRHVGLDRKVTLSVEEGKVKGKESCSNGCWLALSRWKVEKSLRWAATGIRR
jgi:hypothetical protein